MPLLLNSDALARRRAVAAGGLAPLADSLAADLERAIGAGLRVPREKAVLSRAGGVCERDGSPLAFDPWSPHEHRCATCGQVHRGALHDRWWLYPYQLWLAERAVHGAALYAVRGDERHARFAADLLAQYAVSYLEYPNRDNVLGPTRPFFSTYLESIWLLHLCVALDLLEAAGAPVDGAAVRERLVEPSSALIASYDEGLSNRQVWNNAALIAARRLLGVEQDFDPVVYGPSGLLAHLEDGLLDDGTWYEGENYHQFAHRGLWYGLQLAGGAGRELPETAVARFDAGYAATFATALPDLTLPARKDSQYATSLRQWRFAEHCELGLARHDDGVLRAMLAELYDPDAPAPDGDTGRASSSAEAERNGRPVRLTRADLGWKSLLFAREALPPTRERGLRSVLLHGQGVAVFRRERGRVYAALDYGQSGGGHGHPDRLNLLLSVGATRWLDDLGTGSYVDPSLHWYRSTLAHNAPLVDGHSQWRVDGQLEAFDEREQAGWARAQARIWPDVAVQRTLVVMDGYCIDQLRWRAGHAATVALPIHCDAELGGQLKPVRARYAGAGGLEDGDRFVTTERAWSSAANARVQLGPGDGPAGEPRGFARCTVPAVWYTLSGPGQPPGTRRRFHVVESRGAMLGAVCTVWGWTRDLESVEWTGDGVIVRLRDGARHVHRPVDQGWHVDIATDGSSRYLELDGVISDELPLAVTAERMGTPTFTTAIPEESEVTVETAPEGYNGIMLSPARSHADWWSDASPDQRLGYAVYHLGAPTYRRSEQTWDEAGRPAARVAVAAAARLIVVDVQMTTANPRFVPADAVNPYDNEAPDINGDGVQLYVRAGQDGGAWMLVPEPAAKPGTVRARPLDGWGGLKLGRTSWRRTREGYELRAEIALREPLQVGADFWLDVLVNETAPDRERRRGQLILSGPDGEFVYLRGDRHDPARLLRFTVVT
ncbi:MAG: heparinase II/III family protein [Gemmatimonadota bacterium]|nr:heparinase II/III family protein [Gemmatimonadota bacterium]